MTPEVLRALLTIVFGSLAGGITNTVAVWMLFHPHRPPRLGPLRFSFLHGAIPKNQARLASAVGRTVGNRLLTEEDLAGTFSNREFRETFDERLGRFLSELFERERGSLRELLPPELTSEAEAILEEVSTLLGDRVGQWVASDEFEQQVESQLRSFMERVSDEPVGELLTPAREAALAAALEEWAAGAVEREGFREAIDDYLERAFASFLREDRTFEEVLPAGLVSSMERALSGYLPVAVRRLGGILEDPAARERLERAVHDLFQSFLRDLRFHQRVVARLVVTEDTLDRVLTALEAEGAERLSEMLREEEVQDAIARKVNDAVLDFLKRPVTSVLGEPGDENVVSARGTAVGWVLGLARDPRTRGFLIEKLQQGARKLSAGNWGDLFEKFPPEKVAAAVAATARSEAAEQVYRGAIRRTLSGLLDRPIRRPAGWLPDDAARRLSDALSEPLWGWLQSQVPEVVRTLDVGRRVEEKVLAYPTEKMEELVRRVTDRELRMIVRLGYLLGAGIGGILVGLNALL